MKSAHNIIGVLLAAGKGTRFKSKATNKTVSLFHNRPLIQYGLDLYKQFCNASVVVVGAYSESVIDAISQNDDILFAFQHKRLGTGHALIVALREIQKNGLNPDLILLGYGDHMMFYTDEVVQSLIKAHSDPHTAISLVTTRHDNPSVLAWGRIIRDSKDHVTEIIEEKDANDEQKKVTELNSGFYCFSYSFLKKFSQKLQRSPVTGEYYITDFIRVANEAGFIIKPIEVPFSLVGIGINTLEELEKSQSLKQLPHIT